MGATLLLPGERPRGQARPARASFALFAGAVWLVLQSSLLPALGLAQLPFDPLLPLLAAFALGGRSGEAWVLALLLGVLADSFAGTGSGRTVVRYAIVVMVAQPLQGQVVLRDRLVPVVGVAAMGLFASAGLLTVLAVLGAEADWRSLPRETAATFFAALLLWPVYRRIAGWQDDRGHWGRLR
jgi:cell shape-determining protein MreD